MIIYSAYRKYFSPQISFVLAALTYALILGLTVISLSQIGADLRYANV